MDLVEKTRFKDELFEQFARIGKALSSGRRLELVELLDQARTAGGRSCRGSRPVGGEHLSTSSGDEHQFKGELFARFARITNALSTVGRPEPLELLAQAERSIEDLGTSTAYLCRIPLSGNRKENRASPINRNAPSKSRQKLKHGSSTRLESRRERHAHRLSRRFERCYSAL